MPTPTPIVYIDRSQVVEEGEATTIRLEGSDATYLKKFGMASETKVICRVYPEIEHTCSVLKETTKGLVLRVLRSVRGGPKPFESIRLFLGLGEAKTFQSILTHATELEASEAQPVVTERSNKRFAKRFDLRKHEEIVARFTKQFNREEPMNLREPISFKAFLDRQKGSNETGLIKLLPWECADYELASTSPLKFPNGKPKIDLFVGPEGGLSLFEKELLERSGFQVFSLFPKTLGVELATVLALNYCWRLGSLSPNRTLPRRTRFEPD